MELPVKLEFTRLDLPVTLEITRYELPVMLEIVRGGSSVGMVGFGVGFSARSSNILEDFWQGELTQRTLEDLTHAEADNRRHAIEAIAREGAHMIQKYRRELIKATEDKVSLVPVCISKKKKKKQLKNFTPAACDWPIVSQYPSFLNINFLKLCL